MDSAALIGLLLASAYLLAFGRKGRGRPLPADFALRYNWAEASVPPPYHFEYAIRIGPGHFGELAYVPDYPADGVPLWIEPLSITQVDLERLHAMLAEKGVFTTEWQSGEGGPVGDSQAWLEATASGRRVQVPAHLRSSRQREELRAVYEVIRACVPAATWEKLERQRQQYHEDALAPKS
jgi:hypothetical protein